MTVSMKYQAKLIRKQYPIGTKIKLGWFNSKHQDAPSGSIGTVWGIDDVGQLLVCWENGGKSSLIPGVDSFSRI